MKFNLITDPWIPVRRRDNSSQLIMPHQLTSEYQTNPIISLNAPRPDFNGALIQFLIGLVQTAAPPEDEDEWEDHYDDPPSSEILNDKFMKVSHAFELGGDNARFMQDFTSFDEEPIDIGKLLIECPGDETLRKNLDHFVKRGTVCALCPACCTAALFTLQLNAPAGGQGHRTSLRGGGPLTTIILSGAGEEATLWQTVWLNVLENEKFMRICGNPDKKEDVDKFPWLGKTRTSESKTGSSITALDVHPAQMYWGMPRRIRLNLKETISAHCDLCGIFSENLIISYNTKNYGIKYKGAWLHPLTPHDVRKNEEIFPIHAQPGGITYRHWLGFVQEDNETKRKPARVVHVFRQERQRHNWQFRLWAFGYNMDKMKPMKAKCWYDSTIPIFPLKKEIKENYEYFTTILIISANKVADNLIDSVKKGFGGQFKERNGKLKWEIQQGYEKEDKTMYEQIGDEFWYMTETEFYSCLMNLKDSLEREEDSLFIRKRWHKCIADAALHLFDRYVWNGPIENKNPKSIVLARKELRDNNYSEEIIQDVLRLPGDNKK